MHNFGHSSALSYIPYRAYGYPFPSGGIARATQWGLLRT